MEFSKKYVIRTAGFQVHKYFMTYHSVISGTLCSLQTKLAEIMFERSERQYFHEAVQS